MALTWRMSSVRNAADRVLHIMQLRRKPFDLHLHDKCDPGSRDAVIDFMRSKFGYEFESNDDRFGIDLISRQIVDRLELEQRINWWKNGDPTLNFSYITMPGGKGDHYWQPDNHLLSHYIILRDDLKHCGMVEDKDIRPCIDVDDDKIDWKKTRYTPPGQMEPFYRIPYYLFKWYDMATGELVPSCPIADRQSRPRRTS